MRIPVLAAAATWLAMTLPAAAGTITIDTSLDPYRPGLENQGWWPPTIGYSNNSESDDHFVGWSTPGFADTEVRSFFSFSLGGAMLDGATVTSASLVVRRGEGRGDAPQETVGVFDVTSPLATVMHNVSTNVAVWTDLGTGVSYGAQTFPVAGNPDDTLVIPLNSAGVAAINAAIGTYFTVGAALTSGDGMMFRQSPGSLGTQALVLVVAPVPEPRSLALLAVGLLLIALRGRREGARRGSVVWSKTRHACRSRSHPWDRDSKPPPCSSLGSWPGAAPAPR